MLYCVTGRPGEGKSCFAVLHIILEELCKGQRPIYTNIFLKYGKIYHYCKELGYKIDTSRLHHLEETQIANFWEHTERGSLIVLDEVAEFFNSQDWSKLGCDPGSYARLHRHFEHEVYLVVQDADHILKQFRDLVAINIQLVNLHNKKFLGFRWPKFFSAKYYDMQVKKANPSKTPQAFESKLYRYNNAVFSLYDTHQVFSVSKGLSPKKKKGKYKKTDKGKTRLLESLKGVFSRKALPIAVCVLLVGGFLLALKLPGWVAGITSSEDQTDEKQDEKSDVKKIIDNTTGAISGVVRNVGKSKRSKRGGGGNYTLRYDASFKRDL